MTMIEYPKLKKLARKQLTFNAFIGEVRAWKMRYEIPLWTVADYEHFYQRFTVNQGL